MMVAAADIAKFIGVRGFIAIGLGIVLGTLLGLQTHKTHVAQKAAASWEKKYEDEHTARQLTILNYRVAAQQAEAADKANVARVAAQQRAINERTSSEYEARLADARARADRLRSQLEAGANPGSPAAAGVSDTNAAPGSADAAASEDGLSISDRLLATEQAIQLDELIKWLDKNLKVDMSGSSSQPSTPTGSR